MELIYKVESNKDTSFKEKVEVYGRMIKFSHSIFALPFALSAVILATRTHSFSVWKFFWIVEYMFNSIRQSFSGVLHLFEEVQARSGCSALMTHCFQVICEFFCKFA